VNDQLENDLCELFASRASAVPAEATIGVRGVDFHPRAGHLWSPKLTVGSLAGLATTGMVVRSSCSVMHSPHSPAGGLRRARRPPHRARQRLRIARRRSR
jgi:hypothetical protein